MRGDSCALGAAREFCPSRKPVTAQKGGPRAVCRRTSRTQDASGDVRGYSLPQEDYDWVSYYELIVLSQLSRMGIQAGKTMNPMKKCRVLSVANPAGSAFDARRFGAKDDSRLLIDGDDAAKLVCPHSSARRVGPAVHPPKQLHADIQCLNQPMRSDR